MTCQGTLELPGSQPPGAAHDPGGKVRTALPAGMTGGARFAGPQDCYRTLLWRSWGTEEAPYLLWIGMNPSTATAEVNDPTITREVGFTRREGFTRYLKCNVSAYRCTDPKKLPIDQLHCEENLQTIIHSAGQAAIIVMAFGALDGPMRVLAEQVTFALMRRGLELWCLGTTNDGSPRHPLYLPRYAPLLRWNGW